MSHPQCEALFIRYYMFRVFTLQFIKTKLSTYAFYISIKKSHKIRKKIAFEVQSLYCIVYVNVGKKK